jgi:type II secretory pathway pseudopilin PulG
MKFYQAQSKAGITLVELLIVTGITVVIFSGLFASVQYTFRVIANSSAKLSALSLANDRMEYFRSLPYNDVGTIAGIPTGTIPQNSTTTLNGIEFAERVLVEYVDDPADGALTATTTDSNGIPSDYKRIKLEVSWTLNGQTDNISLVSNVVPRSIETTSGGGTVRVNVLDADSTFLSGAEVRLLNETTTTTIDVTRFSDLSGAALFSGAPAASNYQIFVTAPGYSSDQTYEATTTNPNPVTAPFAVLESDISTLSFQIGQLSDIFMTTLSSVTEDEEEEDFTDASGIATSTDTAVVAGELVLAGGAGSYETTGKAFLTQLLPGSLERWESVVIVGDRPPGTDFLVQFYTGTTSAYTLVNNSDLPGNATGFTDSVIDIANLDVGTYPDLTIAITLTTSDSNFTPTVEEVTLYYRTTEVVRPNVGFNVEGNKSIGEELDLTPIKKTIFATSTDGSGERRLGAIEFDSYTFTNTDGLTLVRSCPNLPLQHAAGATSTLEMVLVASVSNSLRLAVTTDTGQPLPGATVDISRTGFSDSEETDACGQVFFTSGIIASADYVITISRSGYTPTTINPYDLSGNSELNVVLNES